MSSICTSACKTVTVLNQVIIFIIRSTSHLCRQSNFVFYSRPIIIGLLTILLFIARDSIICRANHRPSRPSVRRYLSLHLSVRLSLTRVDQSTRELSYRKDDRAMRPMNGWSENFRESLTTPTATCPEFFNGLLFRLSHQRYGQTDVIMQSQYRALHWSASRGENGWC